MTCPTCNGKTGVTRTASSDDHTLRFRRCQACGTLFVTMETFAYMAKSAKTVQKLDAATDFDAHDGKTGLD